MQVRWLRRAQRQLAAAAAYIAVDSPGAADRLVYQVHEAVEGLATSPLMGRQGRLIGTRELVISGTPYIVIYRVRGTAVEVLALHHSSRRWPSHL